MAGAAVEMQTRSRYATAIAPSAKASMVWRARVARLSPRPRGGTGYQRSKGRSVALAARHAAGRVRDVPCHASETSRRGRALLLYAALTYAVLVAHVGLVARDLPETGLAPALFFLAALLDSCVLYLA